MKLQSTVTICYLFIEAHFSQSTLKNLVLWLRSLQFRIQLSVFYLKPRYLLYAIVVKRGWILNTIKLYVTLNSMLHFHTKVLRIKKIKQLSRIIFLIYIKLYLKTHLVGLSLNLVDWCSLGRINPKGLRLLHDTLFLIHASQL